VTEPTEFELELEKVANGGDMMGRHDGKVVFVPYTIPGERIQAQFTEQNKGYSRAIPLGWLETSPNRVDPPCPHYGSCGGCQWQHISYEAQLAYKQSVVIDQLERIGKIESPPVEPVIASPKQWHYRHHVTFTITQEGDFAFWSDDSSILVPIDVCLLMNETLLEHYQEVNLLEEPGIDRVRFQVGTNPEDIMLVLYSTAEEAPELEVDLPVSINLLLPDNEPMNLVGDTHVTYRIFDRAFRVTAGSFFQTNVEIAHMLVDFVLEKLDLQGHETILDLYAGVGLFTSFIAERADLVVSVESYPPAVTDADINMSDLENVDLVEGPVEGVLRDLVGPFDAVVLDPPRSGLDTEVIDELARLEPPVIVYVSCDVATLARDIKRLVSKGYHLESVQPFDMFPQTYHIESVAVLRL